MPTNRFSTISTRPTPCFPPSLFKARITPKGESFLPLTATQSPFRNSSVTYSGLLGASSGETDKVNIFRFVGAKASNQGSSKIPASYEICRRFRSME